MTIKPFRFRLIDGQWQRQRTGDRGWQQLRIEERTVEHERTVTKTADGKDYHYTHLIEETVKDWIWEDV